MKLIRLVVLLLLWTEANLQAENQVIIRGRKKERYHRKTAGRSVLIRPTDGSRMSSDTHLKEESSFDLVRTDKVSATGFQVPSVRGQEQKLTEVSLGDMLIYDPLSSLPLLVEPDLQAFGQMEIFHGVSPWNSGSVSPVGHIRYSMREFSPPGMQAGVRAGQPYGHSLWSGHSGRKNFSSGLLSWRLFGRTHQTNGRFSYYDDKGNPYVPQDGEYRIRENNDGRTSFLVPWLHWQNQSHSLQLLGIRTHRDQGLTGYGARSSLARQRTFSTLLSPVWSWQPPSGGVSLLPDTIRLAGLFRKDSVFLSDPFHPQLQEEVEQRTGVSTDEENISFQWDEERWKSEISAQTGTATLRHTINSGAEKKAVRRHQQLTVSAFHQILNSLAGEWKGMIRTQQDSYDTMTQWFRIEHDLADDGLRRESYHKAGSVSLTFAPSDFSLYTQAAWFVRPPSLWEEFGNSDYVMPNLSLTPEKIRHREAGLRYQNSGAGIRLFLTWFEDSTDDKIIFLPAFSNTYRAENLRRTKVTGLECGGEWDTDHGQSVGINTSYRSARILSFSEPKKIPGVPDYQAVLSGAQRFGELMTLWSMARHQGPRFLDAANSMRISPQTTWDLSADFNFISKSISWQTGFNLANLTDIKTMEIRAPESGGQEGITSYSEIQGYPLPGRQWTVYLTAGW